MYNSLHRDQHNEGVGSSALQWADLRTFFPRPEVPLFLKAEGHQAIVRRWGREWWFFPAKHFVTKILFWVDSSVGDPARMLASWEQSHSLSHILKHVAPSPFILLTDIYWVFTGCWHRARHWDTAVSKSNALSQVCTRSPQGAEKEVGSVGKSLTWACLPCCLGPGWAFQCCNNPELLGPTTLTSHPWSHFAAGYYSDRGPIIKTLWCSSNCIVGVKPTFIHIVCLSVTSIKYTGTYSIFYWKSSVSGSPQSWANWGDSWHHPTRGHFTSGYFSESRRFHSCKH